jgi:hypothetical protein
MSGDGLPQQRHKRRAGASRGQGLVELAVIIVILVMLTVSSVDLGVFMYKYVQAANCVREAARRAAVRADNAGSPPYCLDAGLQPTLNPANYKAAATGSDVEATINVSYDFIALGYFIPGISGTINAHTKMRMEGQKI